MTRLLQNLALFALGCLSACGSGSELDSQAGAEDRLSVLLISLDTTRGDALESTKREDSSQRSAQSSESSGFGRLAAESLSYVNAFATAPITLPSHASMLTGLYPPRHGVRDNSLRPVPQSAQTLAELAQQAGFQTSAFVSSAVLDPVMGLDQGFDVYDAVPRREKNPKLSVHYSERPAGSVVQAFEAWFEQREQDQAFLAWLHFFDPHFPYEPPAGFRPQSVGAGAPPNQTRQTTRANYLGEVEYVGSALETVLELLRKDGSLDHTLVILVGDHGEALGEHGESTHATLCYNGTLSVPFLIRYPDGYRAGERSSDVVSVADVFSTALQAMRMNLETEPGSNSADSEVDGQSLYRRSLPDDRGVYFESYYSYLQYGWSPLTGWITQRAKYIHGTDPEWLDWQADSSELNNLYNSVDADEHRPHRLALAILDNQPSLPTTDESVNSELLAELSQLGYATAGGAITEKLPGLLEQTGLPAARNRMGELQASHAALNMAAAGDLRGAIRALRKITNENPRNISAQERLASYLLAESRFVKAEAVLIKILDLGFETAVNRNNLGYSLMNQGRLQEALPNFERALELDPEYTNAQLNVERVRSQLKQ